MQPFYHNFTQRKNMFDTGKKKHAIHNEDERMCQFQQHSYTMINGICLCTVKSRFKTISQTMNTSCRINTQPVSSWNRRLYMDTKDLRHKDRNTDIHWANITVNLQIITSTNIAPECCTITTYAAHLATVFAWGLPRQCPPRQQPFRHRSQSPGGARRQCWRWIQLAHSLPEIPSDGTQNLCVAQQVEGRQQTVPRRCKQHTQRSINQWASLIY